MTFDEFFRLGQTVTLGSHTFEPDEIKAFARKYDPQPFHIDEAQAERSVFGRLCASGWHTCSMWMRLNLAFREDVAQARWDGPGPRPQFGPSPGIRNLKWLKPVYVGDTITFTRRAEHYRPLASRPGWLLLDIVGEAFNQSGDKVLEMENAVLVKTA